MNNLMEAIEKKRKETKDRQDANKYGTLAGFEELLKQKRQGKDNAKPNR